MLTSLKQYPGYLLLLCTVGCQLEDPARPVAAGLASSTDCIAPCVVQFTDASTGTGLYNWTYRWDFGDGTSSNEKNPSHTYTQMGLKRVKFTLSGKYGSAADSSLTVSVKGKGPVANFTISGGNCTAPCTVSFINKSENATSYLWSFGDGITSTEPNPTKTYTSAGKFGVKLTATSANGTNTKTDSITILADATGLKSDFAVEQDNTRSDSTKVKFINMSANATSYQWDFGDKFNSTLKDPIHWYKRLTGKDTSYIVKLKAIGIGETSKEKTMSLLIKKP